jgi:hypothetical protein
MKQSCCGYFNGLLLAILVLIVWFLSSVAITEQVTPRSEEFFILVKDFISSGIGAAFGAVTGAGAAFYWNARREDNKHDDEMVDNLNNAFLTLAHQYNTLSRIVFAIDKHALPEFRFSHINDYRIQNLVNIETLVQALPNIDLSFIGTLNVYQQDVMLDINSTIVHRNHHYEKEVFPSKHLGSIPRSVYKEAQDWTRALRDKAAGRANEIYNHSHELHNMAVSFYPEDKFIYLKRDTNFKVTCNNLSSNQEEVFYISYIDTPDVDLAAYEILKQMHDHSITLLAINESTSSFLKSAFKYEILRVEVK